MSKRKALLSLGVDLFDGGFTPLLGAANDARAWAGLCKHRMGFTVRVLTHEDLRSGACVMAALRELLQPLGEGDLFGLFIATHGKSIDHGVSGHRDQAFLLPDASRRSLEAGYWGGAGVITLGQLEQEAARPGLQRFFIIDARRSPLEPAKAASRVGDELVGDELVAFEGETIYRDIALRRSAHGHDSSPLTLINSCPDRQRAVELRSHRRGIFSMVALEALRSELDAGRDVTLDESLLQAVGLGVEK